jgi:hypothetical protein
VLVAQQLLKELAWVLVITGITQFLMASLLQAVVVREVVT